MILIPQRLFDNPGVTTILRDGNVCILSKDLSATVLKREGYYNVTPQQWLKEKWLDKALTLL